MWLRRVGLAVALALGVGGGACGGSASADDVDPAGEPGPPLPRRAGGEDGNGRPVVSRLRMPSSAAGLIRLTAELSGMTRPARQITVEVARGGGDDFAVATATVGAISSTTEGRAEGVITWDSVRDLGFRAPAPFLLRLTASDEVGAGPAAVFEGPAIENLRAAARGVDAYLANYHDWTEDEIAIAKRHQLVIAHPARNNLSREALRSIQAGVDPAHPGDDVIVLCYISVGEDLRTRELSDDQVRADPRFRGDGTGPRVDPRGPTSDGAPLRDVDARGVPSNGGTGFASFYLDDNDVRNSPDHLGDGFPDRNPIFGGLFVNAGDPAWFETLDRMTIDSIDEKSGLRELLTADYGRGLDCDGLFLDTIDTAAPNSFTNASSANQTEFEWTAPGFTAFIRRLHEAYPKKLLLQNRGLFFFDPRYPHYEHNPGGAIDLVMFESFRLNSHSFEQWSPIHYANNRYDVAPKLMAEANRPDGFRVLSLGYAEGPTAEMSPLTLMGQSGTGFDSLLEDIHVTQNLIGFRHYLTDAAVALVNDFVLRHASLADTEPPWWTSSYNDRDGSPDGEPTPRVGLQEAVGENGRITVRWDVALDKNRVRYLLYAQPAPFDFAADPTLAGAARIWLSPRRPAAYAGGVGPGRFPYEATVSGFPAGKTQHLLLRAVDDSPHANEEKNTVVLTATP